MSRTSNTLRWAAAAAATLAVASTVTAQAAPQASPFSIKWQDCAVADSPPGAECAKVRVPLEWANPAGQTIDVAVVRRKALDPTRRIGTLVYLPGGPGQSGVDTLSGVVEFGGMEQRFDLVSLDVRGVGRTVPIRCSTAAATAAQRDFAAPPRTIRDYNKLRDQATALGEDCARNTAVPLGLLDATSVAKDLDAIRQALGESTLTLYGHSYGTLYAQRYSQAFGRHLRAAVLDGVVDPTLSRRTMVATSARALEEAFGQFATWCKRDAACALHGQDPVKVYDRLAGKARAGTLSNAGTPVSSAELTAELDGMLLTPSWDAVGLYLNALDAGTTWETGQETTPDGPVIDYADPAVCRDLDLRPSNFWQSAVDTAVAAARAPHLRYSPNVSRYGHLCQGFPARPAAVTAPQAPLSTPLLLVGARYDNATPFAWAKHLGNRLGGNAAVVEIDGWGHGMKIFNRGAEQQTVVDYLIDRKAPPTGTVVPGGPPPGISTN